MDSIDRSDECGEKSGNPRLLSDAPADSDALGSHGRVVNAIAGLIEERQAGKAIALSGKWGSGKSTVINLLRSHFGRHSESKILDTRVFVFDAWAHQGDPLRRSFLQELVLFLGQDGPKKEWINKDEWNLKIEGISKSEDQAKKFSHPVLGVLGSIMGILVLLMPLGITLMAKGSTAENIIPGLSDLRFGQILLILPPGLAIVALIVNGIRWLVRKAVNRAPFNKELWKETPELGELNPISYLISKPLQRATSITLRTPEPTSVEFRKFFLEMMVEALGIEARRKLVVVIDNLDRVDSKDAKDIWSTMRTFLDLDGGKDVLWRKKFWLIVAFDPNGIRELWGKHQASDIQGETVGVNRAPAQHEDAQDDLLDVFIDKTFQAKFRISSPALIPWKAFFERQLEEAFGGCDLPDTGLHQLYLLYNIKVAQLERPPTPREIKQFINRVVVLYLKWGLTIPLVVLETYAAHEEQISLSQEPLTGGVGIPGSSLSLLEGVDWSKYQSGTTPYSWREYLGAVHYNLEPVEAIHMLYAESVAAGLREGQTSEILQLVDRVPGLEPLIEHVIVTNAEIWAKTDPAALTNSAKVLADICLKDPTIGDAIWKALGNSVRTIEKWDKINESIGEGLGRILSSHNQEKYDDLSEILLKRLVKLFPATVGPPRVERVSRENEISDWVKASVPILAALVDRESASLIERSFEVPGNARSYSRVISALSCTPLPERIIRYYVSNGDKQEFVPILRDFLASGYIKGEFLDSQNDPIWLVRQIPGDWRLTEVCQTLVECWQSPNGLADDEDALGCLEGIASCAIHGVALEAHEFVNNLPRRAANLERFQSMVGDNNPRAIALAMFVNLHALPQRFDQETRSLYANKLADFKPIYRSERRIQEVTAAFARLLLKFRNFPDMMLKLTNLSTGVFRGDIVAVAAQSFITDYKHYVPEMVVRNYDRFKSEHRGIDLVTPMIRSLLLAQTDFLRLLSEVPYSEKTAGLFDVTLRMAPSLELSAQQERLVAKVQEVVARHHTEG